MFLFLVALEGQITRCDIRSSTLKCCITLMEEAFWGQHYWDWAREVASEMEQSASVCVCVRTCGVCLKMKVGLC